MADVASVALVQDRAAAHRTTLTEQLQTALTSRIVIEQAKGVLSQLGDVDMEQAFLLLRTYARDRNLRLSDVAWRVVSRSLPGSEVLAHMHLRRGAGT